MTAEKVGGVQASYSYNGLGYRTGMSFCRDGKVKKVSYTLDYSRIYDNLLENTRIRIRKPTFGEMVWKACRRNQEVRAGI